MKITKDDFVKVCNDCLKQSELENNLATALNHKYVCSNIDNPAVDHPTIELLSIIMGDDDRLLKNILSHGFEDYKDYNNFDDVYTYLSKNKPGVIDKDMFMKLFNEYLEVLAVDKNISKCLEVMSDSWFFFVNKLDSWFYTILDNYFETNIIEYWLWETDKGIEPLVEYEKVSDGITDNHFYRISYDVSNVDKLYNFINGVKVEIKRDVVILTEYGVVKETSNFLKSS